MATAEKIVLAAPSPPGIARQPSHFATAVRVTVRSACVHHTANVRAHDGHFAVCAGYMSVTAGGVSKGVVWWGLNHLFRENYNLM